MRILVLSNAFESPNYNARLRYQCTYLTNHGHTVEVYTEPWDRLKFEHSYPIHEVGKRNDNVVKWVLQSIYSFFTNYKERQFVYRVLWHTRWQKFDILYCATNSCFPLGAATRIAKIKHLPLHVDICELMELQPNYKKAEWWQLITAFKQMLYVHRRNHALKKAQSVSTLSPKHEEFLKHIHPNVMLLYNGFNPQKYSFEPVMADTFRICFIGYAYSSQSIDMILNVMEKLGDELPKVQWLFYSNDLNYNHIKHASPKILGLLPREILGKSIKQASLLLLLNDTEDNGLHAKQFYQALGTEKPVLYTPTTEGFIPDFIEFTHLGIASSSINECVEYIRGLYHQWEKNGYTHQEVQHKELFNADIQTEKLEQHLIQLASQH